MRHPTPAPDGRRALDHRMSRIRGCVADDAAANALQKPSLDLAAVSRVIEMVWEDRTPFEAIHSQFALDEGAVIALMHKHLKPSSFRQWRERVRGRTTKHAALRPASMREHARHRAPPRSTRRAP